MHSSLTSSLFLPVMTPISDVMCLSSDAILDHEKIDFILCARSLAAVILLWLTGIRASCLPG